MARREAAHGSRSAGGAQELQGGRSSPRFASKKVSREVDLHHVSSFLNDFHVFSIDFHIFSSILGAFSMRSS